MMEGLGVARGRKKEVRVGCDVKGVFFELIKILVHYLELYHSFDIIKHDCKNRRHCTQDF